MDRSDQKGCTGWRTG